MEFANPHLRNGRELAWLQMLQDAVPPDLDDAARAAVHNAIARCPR